MEDGNDLENLFEEYESTNEPQNEESTANTENTDANEANTREVVPVPKRIIRNPRLKFNADRLCGERGIPILTKHFKNVKFKGKGQEKEDLNKLMSSLEHWSHRLFPSMKFKDCLRQIEKLGKKRAVQTCLVKIRRDMPIISSDFVHDEEDEREKMQEEPESEPPPQADFDRLLGESREIHPSHTTSTSLNPQALGTSFGCSLTEKQRKRMEHNKMLANERRKAKLAALQAAVSNPSEDDLGGPSTSLTAPESDISGNRTSVPLESPVAQSQFKSLINDSTMIDQLNDSNHAMKDSEELDLDELMDLVDEEDVPNKSKENDISSVRVCDSGSNDERLGTVELVEDTSIIKAKEKAKLSSENGPNMEIIDKSPQILTSDSDDDEGRLHIDI